MRTVEVIVIIPQDNLLLRINDIVDFISSDYLLYLNQFRLL